MKQTVSLLLCAVLMLGMFSGCTAGGDSPYAPTGDGLTWDEDYTGPTNAHVDDTPEQELTLIYYPGVSFNPYLCTDFTNRALLSLVYQSLFIVDRNYVAQPMLCKSYRISEDMKSYTFYPEKATFSDGSVLTAEDVVASLNYAKESKVYSGRFLHITEILLTSDGGITLNLDTACENLLILLDIPILKASQLEAEQPLGTGPYVLEQGAGGLRLQKRTDWWCRADMAITAQSIALVEAESATHIRDQFEFFDVDLVCADPGSDRYADYRCDFELWDCENGIFLYLAFSAFSQVFTTPEIRSALTYAIDRDTLASNYYRGFARSATLPASPLSPYYNETLASKYSYDSVKFAQAVDAAGLQNSTVVLLVNKDDSLRLRVARAIADMLESCGLVVQLSALSGSDYEYALKTRQFDIYLGQTKLSPNMDLSAFFSTYGELSYGGVNDRAAYALCLESLANYGNYYTLHKTVMDEGLLCPVLFRSYAVYATRGLLTDLTPARDNIFYYSLGKSLEKALIRN